MAKANLPSPDGFDLPITAGLVFPSKTVGPTGMNDAGDPSCFSVPGNTPGPTGMNDGTPYSGGTSFSSCNTWAFYLKEAQDAVDFTRNSLWIGMGNYMNDRKDPRYIGRVRVMKSLIGLVFGAHDLRSFSSPIGEAIGELIGTYGPEVVLLSDRVPSALGQAAIKIKGMVKGDWETKSRQEEFDNYLLQGARKLGEVYHVGNCFEHAAICYYYLLEKGGKPRPVEVMETNDHAFVVIGRRREGGIAPSTWGDKVVVVDAYYNEIYHLSTGTLYPHQAGAKKIRARVES